ncbi:TrkH family potassium uptake protein [Roseinatronobacter alkalisoli]|uniref:TrkH family potassium uptake protein n=1 Tax=Roseinatronobacter alkalisoli TaxID=3028235 RepID=A0ABT5T778_9RHOB|nr:TrkH family potassium uptake protein [Roseinatronobacter sp. HJB301]MDD7970804.1 TrkH family potassium uptake protein [Roseinatronobacter sp. HJB301]
MSRRLSQRFRRTPPPLILAALYGVLIVIGASLLKLPSAATTTITWSDALFTATSAVTVTGLVVLDTGADLTLFGQIVVATLIQLGGLGLMTFAVLVLAALGLPVGITGQLYLRDDLNQSAMGQLMKLVRTILKVVAVCVIVGAVALAVSFVPRFGLWQGLWEALFHSISAFNNAGFSTFPDGLVPFATDPVVNIVIPALFIIGGIGYVVLHDVFTKKTWRKYSLHTKIMLVGTGILIPWSVAMFAALEWSNPGTLGQHDTAVARLVVSWFQGVTTRTAGFNTTDIGAMHDSTSMMFISLMLIGGGPTSTAGGIKVTTFVIMLIATIAFFRRQTQLTAFGRSIGLEQVLKVMALTAISVILVFVGVFLLTLSHDGDFLDIAFEVASAFGTVGLSRGYTGELDDFGRAVIMAVMFLGRVGPLTLGFFLATRVTPRVRYPEGQVHLG